VNGNKLDQTEQTMKHTLILTAPVPLAALHASRTLFSKLRSVKNSSNNIRAHQIGFQS